MQFAFRIHTALVTNRAYSHSTLTRMCESVDLELHVPTTEYHLLVNVKCSLLSWLAKPDAWKLKREGRELVVRDLFPYAEWVECPECGAEVVNDSLDDHVAIRHEGEYRRFASGTTRDEYDDR